MKARLHEEQSHGKRRHHYSSEQLKISAIDLSGVMSAKGRGRDELINPTLVRKVERSLSPYIVHLAPSRYACDAFEAARAAQIVRVKVV